MFFSVYEDATGWELWRSDGTLEGTELFLDINPGGDSSFAGNFTLFKDQLIFTANNGEYLGIYQSNGITQGTQMFKELVLASNFVKRASGLIVVEDLFFLY